MSSYKDAGVDIERGEEAVRRITKHVKSTYTKDVLGGVGWFAGVLNASALKKMEEPVLLATIDGVGTKTAIAATMAALYPSEASGTGPLPWDPWNGIGHDIVNHSANDLAAQGGTPLLFLDYLASSRLDPVVIEKIVAGMSEACKALECVLIGGETAEMPDVYHEGAHDVAGCMIGVAERREMITGEGICAGDVLIALPSSGLHTNGYSLARKVLLEDAKMDLHAKLPELDCTPGEALLKPHTCYSPLVRKLHKKIGLHGVAHITGGGIPGNLPRIFPKGLGAEVKRSAINVLPIFTLIQEKGNVSEEEMDEAMNMGVGMILVVTEKDVKKVLGVGRGYVLGKVVKGEGVKYV